MRFHAVLQRTGKTTTGFEVPPDVVDGLGAGKRPPVRVTFNSYTYRTTVAPMGGAFWPFVVAAGILGEELLETSVIIEVLRRNPAPNAARA